MFIFFQKPKAGLWASYDSLLSKYSRYEITRYNEYFDMRKMKMDSGDETGQRSKRMVYIILITLFGFKRRPASTAGSIFKMLYIGPTVAG